MTEPFALEPDGGKAIPFIGLVKVSADRSAGAFEVIEYRGPATPPPHIHREHDECFTILEGRFDFTVNDEALPASVGSVVFVPRGTPHGFTAEPGSRALLVIVPAGLQGFFEDLGEGLAAGRLGEEIRDALSGKYDSHPVRHD